LEVFGVDDVVHVSFVVGVDAAGGIVLPLSVCDKLVLNLGLDVGDVDGLCEDGAVLVEFDRFGPVVECAGNVDFFSRMLPNRKE